MTDLAERLGFAPTDRVVIVSADDLGASHASTSAVYQALRTGGATSAGLMVPAPWAREAASQYRGEDVGVQLTLNAQYERFRWGPVTRSPSLLDGDGGFPRTVADLWDHADLDEIHRELRVQVERAILWGFDVSHLDTHLSALTLRPEFFDAYLEAAVEFSLPIRLLSRAGERTVGFPLRVLARDEGIVCPDDVLTITDLATAADLVASLDAGVTELVLRPAVDTPELRAYDATWAQRVAAHHTLTEDLGLRTLLHRADVHVTGYRALRDLQRNA